MNLLAIDWVVLLLFMGVLAVAAIVSRKLTKSVAQYTVAGRSLGVWLGLSTGNAEGLGLISIAALCEQGFKSGFGFIWVGIIGLLLIHIPLFGILGLGIQRYRATKVQTLPQYYEMRYSRNVRIFAGITLGIGGVLNMAIFPIVESQLLIAFIGLPETFQLLGTTFQTVHVVLFCVLGLALLFTIVGGMVSVVITDYIQSVIMVVSLTVACFILIFKVGIGNMQAAMNTHLGEAAFNPFKAQSIGILFIVNFILIAITNRLAFAPSLQKFAAAKNEKVVKQMYLLANIFTHGRGMMIIICGIAALAVFGPSVPEGQNPAVYSRIVGGLVLGKFLPPVLMGFALAGFIFASISTNDSYLLSWSSILTNDVICVLRKKTFTPKQHLTVLRLICLLMAIFLFAFGLWYDPKESILQYMYLTGAIFSGCGLITWLGLYWKRTTSMAAWCGLFTGLLLPTIWMLVNQFGWYPEESSLRNILNTNSVTFLSIILPVFIMIVVSLLLPSQTKFVDYGARLQGGQKNEETTEGVSHEA